MSSLHRDYGFLTVPMHEIQALAEQNVLKGYRAFFLPEPISSKVDFSRQSESGFPFILRSKATGVGKLYPIHCGKEFIVRQSRSSPSSGRIRKP
jgi:hypothetical protein